jgi:hypothetical protein
MFRNGQLCVYELMDEASAVRYWEGYAKIAFDAGMSRTLADYLSLSSIGGGRGGTPGALWRS